jgi:hypothetical protein
VEKMKKTCNFSSNNTAALAPRLNGRFAFKVLFRVRRIDLTKKGAAFLKTA